MASLTAALSRKLTPEEATFIPAFAPAVYMSAKVDKKALWAGKRPLFSELLQDTAVSLESRLQTTRGEIKAHIARIRLDLPREEKARANNATQEGQMSQDDVLRAMQIDLQLYSEWTISTEDMATRLYSYKTSLAETRFPIYREGFLQCGKIHELLRLLLRKEVAMTKGKQYFQEDLPGIRILYDLLRSESKCVFQSKMIAAIALHAILQPLKYDENAFQNTSGSEQDKVRRNQTLALQTFFEVFTRFFKERAKSRTDRFINLLQDLNFALAGSCESTPKHVTSTFFLRLVCPGIVEASMKLDACKPEFMQTCCREMRVLASLVQKSANHFSSQKTDPFEISKFFQECTALLSSP